WEQRGAGMSFNSKTQGPLTLERYIADTLEVTKYLKKEYKKEKIYLFGHSWGSLLASLVASLNPEHYYAYIGAGQMGRHKESNEDTYHYLLETAIARGDAKAEREIRAVHFDSNFYKSQSYRKV